MKKLLTLLLILFLFSSVYAGERIIDKLEYRGGIAYAENKDQPYTGKAVERHLNGKKFLEYRYKKGIQEGLEIEWRESGTKEYERNYKNGEKEGLLTRWFEDGQIDYQQNYSGGTRLGPQRTTFNTKTGEVNELEPKDGGAHVSSEKIPFSGKLIQYHDNGNKKLEEHWELTGNVWPSPNRKTYKATYYANGQKASETTYKKAARQREIFWYENGNKEHETTYKSGYKHGVETYWYKNNNKEIQRNYQNGIKVGTETKWHENGNKIKETYWRNSSRGFSREKSFETTYYSNGRKKSEVTYKDNDSLNTETNWHENGQIKNKVIGGKNTTYYKNGQVRSTVEIELPIYDSKINKHGVEINYDKVGRKISTFTYSNGKKNGYAAKYKESGGFLEEYIYENSEPRAIHWSLFGINNIDFSDKYLIPLVIVIIAITPFFFIKTDAHIKSKRSIGDKITFWSFFFLFCIPPILITLFSGKGIYGHGVFFNINDLFELLVMNSPLIVSYFAYKAFKKRKIKAGEIIWKYYGRSLLAAFIIFFVGCTIFFMIGGINQ